MKNLFFAILLATIPTLTLGNGLNPYYQVKPQLPPPPMVQPMPPNHGQERAERMRQAMEQYQQAMKQAQEQMQQQMRQLQEQRQQQQAQFQQRMQQIQKQYQDAMRRAQEQLRQAQR